MVYWGLPILWLFDLCIHSYLCLCTYSHFFNIEGKIIIMNLFMFNLYSDPNNNYLFLKLCLILYDIIDCFTIIFDFTLEFAYSFVINGRECAQHCIASHFMGFWWIYPICQLLNLLKGFYNYMCSTT